MELFLQSLSQLITDQHIRMGPTVYINCSGFIKIDTAEMGDSTDHYIEGMIEIAIYK